MVSLRFTVLFLVLFGVQWFLWRSLLLELLPKEEIKSVGVKIFIHAIPADLLSQFEKLEMNIDSCSLNAPWYTIEQRLPALLQSPVGKPFLTDNSVEADFFLVPHHSTCLYHRCIHTSPFLHDNSTQAHRCRENVLAYMEAIQSWVERTAAWEHSGGRDHLYILPWDWASLLFDSDSDPERGVLLRNRIASSIHLTLLGGLTIGDPATKNLAANEQLYLFAEDKDIVIPPWRDMSLALSLRPTVNERSILAYFRGTLASSSPTYSQGIRQRLISIGEADARLLIKAEQSEFYWHELRHVRFALCPRGWAGWSSRYYDALASGAIPVVIADDWQPPFASDLSLRIKEEEVDNTLDILSAVSEEKIREIQANGERLFKKVIWPDNAQPDGEALNYLIDELSKRKQLYDSDPESDREDKKLTSDEEELNDL